MITHTRSAFTHAIHDELDAAIDRIAHCLNQLTDTQVWERPDNNRNAIGNLVLHLAGNVQQLIGSGIVGEPDTRVRDAEFSTRDGVTKDELFRRLQGIVDSAKATVAMANDEVLLNPIPVGRYDYTGMQAIVRCVAHFRGHTQEIIHMTRSILGEHYLFAGQK